MDSANRMLKGCLPESIFDAFPLPACLLLPQAPYPLVKANSYFLSASQLTAAQLANISITNLLNTLFPNKSSELVTIFLEDLEKVKDQQKETEFSLGNWKVRIQPLADTEGRLEYLLLSFQKDENRVKEKLEEIILHEQALSQTMMNSLPGTFYIFDSEGKFIRWNRTLETVTGYSNEEVRQMDPINFFHSDDQLRIQEHIQQAFKEGKTEVEASIFTKTGEMLPHKFYATRIQYEDKICLIGTGIDIERLVLAEKEALLARDKYQLLVQSLDAIVWEAKIEDIEFTYVSPQSESILGYKPEAWYGKTNFWQNHIHPDDRDKAISFCFNEVCQGRNHQFEYRMIAADGREVWLNDVVSIVYEEGKPVMLRGVMTDITARKLTEEALEKSRLKLQKILFSSLDVVCTLDREGYFQDVSEASLAVWGYAPEEVRGKNYQNFIHPEDLELTIQAGIDIRSGILKKDFENRYIRKDGSVMQNSWSARWDEQDGLMYCVARDATERHTVEQLQKLSEQRFRSLVQDGSDMVGILDMEGNYLYVSPTTLRVLGTDPESYLGRNAFEFIHPDDKEAVYSNFSRLETEKYMQIAPFRFQDGEGNWRWVETTVTNLIDNPAVGGIVTNSRDVTEQVEAEQRMRALNQELTLKTRELSLSNEQLEQFAYIASHDLQEPLRMVTSFLTQIEKKYNPILDDKGKRYIYFAVDGASRMRQIILDLLEYSRVGAENDDIEEVQVQDVLENIKVLNQKRIQEKQAEILYGDIPPIYTSRIALQQVLQNLISNGLKFQKEGSRPRIEITFSENNTHYCFGVRDNGIGIESDYFDKIFVIFQRLHGKSEYSGTGMGLPICKKIVDRFDGKIWVESEYGQGSTFYFTLKKPMRIEAL